MSVQLGGRVVAVLEERREDAVELPRRARAGREVLGPGEVELEQQILVARQRLLVFHEAHEAPVVVDDGLRARAEQRDLALHEALFYSSRAPYMFTRPPTPQQTVFPTTARPLSKT